MTSWHKWTERKPTEADADGVGGIEWYSSAVGTRWFCDIDFIPEYPLDAYWRTPTPLPGEESGPCPERCDCRGDRSFCPNAVPSAAESDSLRAENAHQHHQTNKLSGEILRLRSENTELQKGVERYRFLAGADVPQHSQRWSRWNVEYWDGFHGGWQPLVGTQLDDAIDAALAAVKAQEEGK